VRATEVDHFSVFWQESNYLHDPDATGHVPEKFLRPNLQRQRVPDERSDLSAGLVHVECPDRLIETLLKSRLIERPAFFPVAALAKTLLKVRQVKLGVVGGLPDHVVPIPPLDPPFPAPAEDGMPFSGKKIRKRISPHGKRYGLKKIARVCFKARRRVRVDLKLDLENLPAVNAV
jgi:hypothetical protein